MIIISAAVSAVAAVLLAAGLFAGAGSGTALLYAAVLCLLAAGVLLPIGTARSVRHRLPDDLPDDNSTDPGRGRDRHRTG